MTKRALTFILSLIIVVGMVPQTVITAFAASTIIKVNCGDDVECIIDTATNIATFNGTGAISPYSRWEPDAYYEYYKDVNKIVIAEGVTGISTNAFCYFYSVEEIIISSTVSDINVMAFVDGSGRTYFSKYLSTFYVNENNMYFSANKGVLYNKEQTKLVLFPRAKGNEYVVPEGVTTIGKRAFCGHYELTEVSLPQSLEKIENSAFCYCRKLKKINIPEKCTEFGSCAFAGCSSLEYMKIPEGTTEIVNNMFSGGCEALKSVDLPSTLRKIHFYAFSNCKNLTNIRIPDNVYFIDTGAFANCDSLKTVELSKNVSDLGVGSVDEEGSQENVWGSCDNLTAFYVDEDNENLVSVDGVLYTKDKKEVVAFPSNRSGVYCVENGVEIICEGAFEGAARLSGVTLPDSLEHINEKAFAECSFDTVEIPEGVRYIGFNAFYDSKIKTLTLPASVENAGTAFYRTGCLEELIVLNNNCDFVFSQMSDSLVVKGYKGSAAEKSANEFGIPFINIDTHTDYYEKVGQIAVVTRKPNGTTLAGCTITVGEEKIVADGHTTYINIPDGYKGEVVVSKDGYLTSTLSTDFLKKYNFFVMYPNTETKPVTQHFLLRSANSSGNGFVDLLRSNETIYDLGNKKHDIYVDVQSNGNDVKSIYLLQGKKDVSLRNGMNENISTNGLFNSKGGTIYLCIETTDGKVYKTNSGIIAAKTRVSLDADIGGSVSGVVDEELSAVGGWNFEGGFDMGNVPVSISISENKVVGTVGIKGNENSTATWYEAIKKTVKKHEDTQGNNTYSTKEIEQLEKELKDNGGDLAEGYSSFGIDVSCSILGFIEGNWNPVTAKLENVKIGLILKVAGEAGYTQQSTVVIVGIPVPYYWQVQFELGIASKINGIWAYDENDKINFSVVMTELAIETEISGKLCLGFDDLIGGGGQVHGGMTITFKAPDYNFTTSVWELSYGVGLTGQLAGYSGDLDLKTGAFQLYPQNETKTLSLSSENLVTEFANSNKLVMAEYSLSSADFNGDTGGGKSSTYNFKSNGYTYSSPVIATISDGTAVMVWVDYDMERSDVNKTALFYSVYNPADNTWSLPLQVENDGTADDFPVLKTFNDRIFLVWNDSDKSLSDNSTYMDMLGSMGISYAEFDGSEFGCITSISGQNEYMDIGADIALVNYQPVVVWLANQENDIFGQQGISTINSAKLNNGIWQKTVVTETASPVNSLTVVDENGGEVIYYSMDVDASIDTSEDYEIFKIFGGETSQVTNNGYADSVLSATGGKAYWLSNNSVKSSTGDTSVCDGIGNEYVVLEDEAGVRSIIYAVSEADGKTTYNLCKESEYGFSQPVLLTSGDYVCGGFDAYWKNEKLVLVSNEYNEDDLTSSINIYEFDNVPVIGLENAYYDQYTLMKGSQLRANVIVKNNGFETANGYKIHAYAGDTLLNTYETETVLLPGQVSDNKLYIDLPQDIDFLHIDFTVEYSFGDNNVVTQSYAMPLGLQDVSLENAIIVSDNEKSILNVSVVNRGVSDLSDITVYLRKNSEDGEVIDSCNISELSSRQENIARFDVSNYAEDVTSFYVTADTLSNEQNIANNSDFALFTQDVQRETSVENVYDRYEKLNLNENKTVTIDANNMISVLVFEAESTGVYKFEVDSDFYASIEIKDKDGNILTFRESDSIIIKLSMQEGDVCLIEMEPYYGGVTGDYRIYADYLEGVVPIESIDFDIGETYTGYVGEGLDLMVQFEPEGTYEEVTWSSSDSSVVSVSGFGMDQFEYIEFLKPGTATITATSESGLKATCLITVKNCVSLSDMEFNLNGEGTYTLTGCNKNAEGKLVLPDTYDGIPVTGIGEDACKDCTYITGVSIPDSVIQIGDSAFSGCSSLSEINLPESLTFIGYGILQDTAYYNDKENWNGELLYIGEYLVDVQSDFSGEMVIKDGTKLCAFNMLSMPMVSLHIPASLVDINAEVIMVSAQITVDEDSYYYTAVDDVLFDKYQTKLICYPSSKSDSYYELPDTVSEIYSYAFYMNTNLRYVDFGDSLTKIGTAAFLGSGLTAVVLPENVKYIGDLAFVTNSVKCVCVNENVEYIGSGAFGGVFVNIFLPSGVTCLQEGAIYCDGFGSIYFGGTEEELNTLIENGQIQGEFVEVYTSSNATVERYGDYLYTVDSHGNILLLNYIGNDENVVIPSQIKDKKVTDIGIAFLNYNMGEDDFISNNIKEITIPEAVTEINLYAFMACLDLKNVYLPGNLETIAPYAFAYCYNLSSVTLSDKIKSVGEGAFAECASLSDVYYSGTQGDWETIEIGEYNEFLLDATIHYNHNCSYGGWSTVEPSCTKVGYKYHTCTDCGNKEFIEKPALGHDCDWDFDYDLNLKIGNCAQCGEELVEDLLVTDIITLILNDAGTAYTVIDCLSDYTYDIIIPETYKGLPVTAIGTDAFRDCLNVTSVVIPDSVTSIGGSAFRNCTSLVTIDLPDNITNIPGAMCYGCTSLETVIIPDGIRSMGGYAFSGCSDLKYVFYEGNDTSWGNITIGSSNTHLTDVPVHYNSIGEHAPSSEWIIDKDATCTENGTKHKECSVCKKVLETSGIMAEHKYVDGVCSFCGLPEDDLIESAHPYLNYTNESWTIHKEGAKRIAITFSESTYTEYDWDFIYIFDSLGNQVGRYSGDELAGVRIVVPGDTITITLTSDGSYNYYGFALTNIETYYEECLHTETEVRGTYSETCVSTGYTGDTYCLDCNKLVSEGELIPADGNAHEIWEETRTATCVKNGYVLHYCEYCDYSYKTDITPATGIHNYVSGLCIDCGHEAPDASISYLKVGDTKTVTVANDGDYYYFYFIPEKSGVYSFASIGDADTYGYLYDSDFNTIKSNDDAGEGYNFKITLCLEAYKKYIIGCRAFDSDYTGSFDVSCNYDFYIGNGVEIRSDLMFVPLGSTNVSDFAEISDNVNFECTPSHETLLFNYYGTGSLFSYFDENGNSYEYTIVVSGDTNGDSICDALDCFDVERAANGNAELTDAYAMAADSNSDEMIDITDYQAIVNKAFAS